MDENIDSKDNVEKPKLKFFKDKKNILILILIVLLLILVTLFCRSTINQSKMIDLQSQIQTLSDSNKQLSLKVENSEAKITELENDRNTIKSESETLQSEKDSLETELQQLKDTNDTVGTYKDGSILFKDSNDTNYRNALYKFSENDLYVNLYQNSTDICVSTDFFKCTKN